MSLIPCLLACDGQLRSAHALCSWLTFGFVLASSMLLKELTLDLVLNGNSEIDTAML